MLKKLGSAIKIFKMRRELRLLISNYLFFIENENQTIWGSISSEDEDRIIELTKVAASFPGPIVELGTLFGLTTQLIATYKPIEKKLITVENFSWNPFCLPQNYHRILTHRILRYNILHCNTSVFDGSTRKFYDTYNGERPSMIFIDADHAYEQVKEDIQTAINLKIPIIAGHDYCDLHPGVKRAVDEIFQGKIQIKGSVWHHLRPDYVK
jgi:hypothetical protein